MDLSSLYESRVFISSSTRGERYGGKRLDFQPDVQYHLRLHQVYFFFFSLGMVDIAYTLAVDVVDIHKEGTYHICTRLAMPNTTD